MAISEGNPPGTHQKSVMQHFLFVGPDGHVSEQPVQLSMISDAMELLWYHFIIWGQYANYSCDSSYASKTNVYKTKSRIRLHYEQFKIIRPQSLLNKSFDWDGIPALSTHWNTLQWNLKRNSYIFIQENAYENVVWQMAAILPRPQCIDILWIYRSFQTGTVVKNNESSIIDLPSHEL